MMKKQFKCLLPSLILAVALIFAFSLIPTSHTYAGTSVYIDPPMVARYTNETSVGDTFTVSLKFDNFTDLAGIEYKIYWNNSVLNVVSVIDMLPWVNPFIATNLTDNNFNATHGRMWFVAVDVTQTPYTGSGTAREITFNITSAPATDLTLYSLIEIQGSIFGDHLGEPIIHDVHNGEFFYFWVIPEFSGATLFAALLATTATLIVYVRYFKRGREFPK
jgi:hypothetical protein